MSQEKREMRQGKSQGKLENNWGIPVHRVRRKALLSVCAVLAGMWLSSFGGYAFAADSHYTDLPSRHWAYGSVEALSQKGVVQGYPDGRFKPGEKVTYGEFIKMTVMMAEGPTDVEGARSNAIESSNHLEKKLVWSASYYRQGIKMDLFTEHSIPEAKLEWQIPRKDMALILDGILPEVEGVKPSTNLESPIRRPWDVDPSTSIGYQILNVYSAGILKGYPDGSFQPEGTLTRGEAAAALHRLLVSQGQESIRNLVSNLEEHRKDSWLETEEYIILKPEEAALKIRVPFTGNLASFDHVMVGFIYIVKDGRIVEYCRSIPAETFITSISHIPVESIDYLVCIPANSGNQKRILVVPDPFRKTV